MAPSLPLDWAAVLAALKAFCRVAQCSQLLLKCSAYLCRGLWGTKIWLFCQPNLTDSEFTTITAGAFRNTEKYSAESESAVRTSTGVSKHLEVRRSTGQVTRSVWEDRVLLLDWFTFCRCIVCSTQKYFSTFFNRPYSSAVYVSTLSVYSGTPLKVL